MGANAVDDQGREARAGVGRGDLNLRPENLEDALDGAHRGAGKAHDPL